MELQRPTRIRAGESTTGAGRSAGGSADGMGHPWVTRYELWNQLITIIIFRSNLTAVI
jgi:hypothetical protein